MSEYTLPLFIEYQSSVRSRRVEIERNGGKPDAPFWHYFNWASAFTVTVLLVSAIYVAAKSKQWFFVCFYIAGVIQWCRWVYQDGARQRNTVLAWVHDDPGDVTKLEFLETGFKEHDRGIESFAPWSAMKCYFMKDGVLSIELANNLRAVIAGDTLKPANLTIEVVEKILLDHGVSKRG